ncbi:MAG: ABC transporter ATP-binding protein, partial [Chloroflexi bacterium]|nr:ABC transporter ATP-binding protein [Chloroflexota bacterium]
MGFILDGLDTEDYDRSYSDRELVDRIIDYFRPYFRRMLLVGAMVTLNSLAGVAGPIIIARAIDIIAENPATQVMALLALGVSLTGASAWVFNFIRQYFSAKIVGEVVLTLRRDVFAAMIYHEMSFFDEHSS